MQSIYTPGGALHFGPAAMREQSILKRTLIAWLLYSLDISMIDP